MSNSRPSTPDGYGTASRQFRHSLGLTRKSPAWVCLTDGVGKKCAINEEGREEGEREEHNGVREMRANEESRMVHLIRHTEAIPHMSVPK